MGLITIFKDIHTTSTPFWRETSVIIDRIKSGNSKQLIDSIRKEPDKKKRDLLKRGLPSICFSGKFKTRTAENIIEHSGLICLDFDHFDNESILNEWRNKLQQDKFTHILFLSPSGDGLKCVVKIPAEIKNHRRYFDKLNDYYNCQYFDRAVHDICRVCYESFDNDLYYNADSEIWQEKNDFQEYEYHATKPILPVTQSAVIIQKLQVWFDKNFSVTKGERNKNVFIFASSLNDYGINENEAVNYLGHYASSDFTIREIERIVQSAYSKRENHGTKYFEDIETKQTIRREIQSGKDIKRIYSRFDNLKKEEIDSVVEEIQATSTISEFWYFDKHGNCHISNHKFKVFLEQNGFCKYYPQGGANFIFIKIENSFIENTTSTMIKDFVLDYLLKQETLKPYEFMASATKYFKDDYLSLLKAEDIRLFEDDEDYMMIYFRNCAVQVFKDSVKTIDYLNLDGMVWKHHVIDRDFIDSYESQSLFEQFINLVANNDIERALSIESTIGYLMHSFKTSANNKAVIFNDEKISENPNGGSGKGIIINALGHIKRVCVLDGKQFDFNKSFPYQTVSIDTQLLVFDDVKKYFGFEGLFSLITEGVTLEKKNKDAIKIPVHKSPKIIITTNYTITGEGGSFDRRKHEIELSSYFNANHTPLDEFGIMLFDQFDTKQWLDFDNFMIRCGQLYLSKGLLKHKYENLIVRKFISETNFDFYEWSPENLPVNERLTKNERFNQFVQEYPDNKKLTQKRFSMWIDCYARFINQPVNHGNSNGQRWVVIGEEQEKVKQELIF